MLTGIIRSEDRDAITLATANETLTDPPALEVEDRKPSEQSMMPEGLWAHALDDHETRSLVAYLAGAGPGADAGHARDHQGPLRRPGPWPAGRGTPGSGRSNGGEIVGKTAGPRPATSSSAPTWPWATSA